MLNEKIDVSVCIGLNDENEYDLINKMGLRDRKFRFKEIVALQGTEDEYYAFEGKITASKFVNLLMIRDGLDRMEHSCVEILIWKDGNSVFI